LKKLTFNQVEITEFENLYKTIQKEFSEKSEDTRLQINQLLKSFENEVFRNLEKKANVAEVNNMLNTKADLIQFNSSIQNKVNVQEFEQLRLNTERLNKEIVNKLDFNKFDAYMIDTRSAIEELQKELILKPNTKDIMVILGKKADIEKVNDALIQVTEDLDQKCSIQQVIYFFLTLLFSSTLQWIIKQ
jgi:hypothetical protein